MSIAAHVAPPALAQGALVRVFAPSSPFERERFERGLSRIEARYRTRFDEGLFSRTGFLAGDDEQRLGALVHALEDREASAIVAARGGYGATRLLPHLDPLQVRAANRWLVGFSDITALHALWARAGLCSIHGPMVASLADAPAEVERRWFALLEGEKPADLAGLSGVRPGRAEGRLFGGNLTVLAALVGTPFMPDLSGTVLVLEDVTERPYRLDRALTTMLQAGVLRGVRGVALGQFSQCDAGPDGVTALEVLEERLGQLGVPVVAGAPVGHVPDNQPLMLGVRVGLDAGAGTLSFL